MASASHPEAALVGPRWGLQRAGGPLVPAYLGPVVLPGRSPVLPRVQLAPRRLGAGGADLPLCQLTSLSSAPLPGCRVLQKPAGWPPLGGLASSTWTATQQMACSRSLATSGTCSGDHQTVLFRHSLAHSGRPCHGLSCDSGCFLPFPHYEGLGPEPPAAGQTRQGDRSPGPGFGPLPHPQQLRARVRRSSGTVSACSRLLCD